MTRNVNPLVILIWWWLSLLIWWYFVLPWWPWDWRGKRKAFKFKSGRKDWDV